MQKLISIISIVKDDAQALEKTLQSIAKQIPESSLDEVEVLVVDGSRKSDATQKVIENFAPLITWSQSEPDGGIYNAMNIGIDQATGKYWWFMNADDTLAEANALQLVLEAINENPDADFFYSDYFYTNKFISAKPLSSILKHMPTSHQAMLFKNGPLRYQEKYKIAADFQFVTDYLRNVVRPVYIQHPLARYKGGGISEQKALTAARESFQIRRLSPETSWQENIGMTAKELALVGISNLPPPLFKGARSLYRFLAGKPQGKEGVTGMSESSAEGPPVDFVFPVHRSQLAH